MNTFTIQEPVNYNLMLKNGLKVSGNGCTQMSQIFLCICLTLYETQKINQNTNELQVFVMFYYCTFCL